MITIKKSIPILLVALIISCADLLVSSIETSDSIEDFEIAWNAINSAYPLLDYKQLDWDNIYSVYRLRAEQSSGDEIQKLIYDLLKELKDMHVLIMSSGGGQIIPYIPQRVLKDKNAFHPLIIRNYFDKELKLACINSVEYEILNNNIGYISIAHFNGENQLDDFPVVMEYIKNTNGLIIDVRGNTGGSSSNYDGVVSRFIKTPLEYLPTFSKNRVPWGGEPIMPNREYYSYANPVVILINGASVSGGEVFPELMKKLPNVTLIGDTTAGAAASDYGDDNIQGEFKLSCGLTIRISTVYVTRDDGLPIEWNGVLPDILIPQSADDIKNQNDKQLDYAINYLNDE